MKIKTIVSTLMLLASLKAVQAQTVLVDWTFDNASNTPPIINPAASAGVYASSAVAQTVGMTNTYTTSASTGAPDVVNNPAVNSDSTPSLPDAWRIRALGGAGGNGWSQAAPVGAQGAQFTVSTVGYYNVQLTFDITATTQGEGLMQVQYTTDGINWSNAVLTYAANPALVLNNVTTSFGNVTNGLVVGSYFNLSTNIGSGSYNQIWFTNITANLNGIPAANNNPNFAVRIVNAAMGTNCISAKRAALNNTSGNWSIDNVEVTGIPPIAQWNFEGLPIATTLNPAPSINNTVNGVSVAALGMSSYAPDPGTTAPDVLQGATSDTGSDLITNITQVWRIRATGSGNGWSSQAPIGAQGGQFNVDTTGYSNVLVSFDWYLTAQGEGNLQLEYTTDGTTWSNLQINIPAAQAGTYIQLSNNIALTDPNSVQGYFVNAFSGANWFTNLSATITDPLAANNPKFAIAMVNASTGASCVNSTGGALNNSSGNWRFDNITVAGQIVSGGAVLLTPPLISAATNATVDGPFTNTFSDSAAWRAAITNITVNGKLLLSSAYSVSAGQIVFTPSVTNLLQSSGTKTIVVLATNYVADSVTQVILPGVPKVLAVAQPIGPTGNGGTLVSQPAVSVEDQYGNLETNISGTITASVGIGGTGSWTFGTYSGTTVALNGGTGSLTNLSTSSSSAVVGAVINLSVSGAGLSSLPYSSTNCTPFNIPGLPTVFTPGNLAVEQEDLVTKNSTFSMLELSPTVANQSTPVNIFPVPATGTNGLRQSSSGSAGRLADSDDGTLLCFSAGQCSDSTVSDVTTVDPRGAGSFNYLGQYVLQATYIGLGDATADQARSAITIDNTNWYMGDKGGVYVNGGAYIPYSTNNSANVRSLKSFGGTIYAMQQEGGTDPFSTVVQFLGLPNGTPNIPGTPPAGNATLFPLEHFPADGTVLDFYMLQSGNNTNIYDYCYYIDGTNGTSGAIFKYYYTGSIDGVSGQQVWASTGASWPTTNGGDGLCARTNSSGGVDLFYTTGSGGTAGNSVVMVHDSAAWNQPINLTATNILYTVSANSSLRGIAFAPVPPASVVFPITPVSITTSSPVYSSTGPGNGSFTLSFTNAPGISTDFTILATTNIALPLSQWTPLGNPTEGSAGHYSFTDTSATNGGEYYIIKAVVP